MAGTRSARKADDTSSPAKGNDVVAGTKRKQEVEPSPKRDRKTSKKQATIEETMDASKLSDSDTKDASDDARDIKDAEEAEAEAGKDLVDESDAKALATGDDEKLSTTEENKEEDTEPAPKANEAAHGENTPAQDSGAIESSSQRAQQMPSNILEKGIIYFFTRNRVGIEESESVGDLQRTFFVLRPMPSGAKLGDGALPDTNNIRLFALPKKVFPKSHNDRFMAFVEKANTSIKELKESFFGANEYETKTQGSRRTEPVAPVAEGVYAITRTEDRTCHLVYSTTIPSQLGEVQEDLGIKDQGSFIMSVKNPERSGPANAQLDQKPGFPKEFIEEFRGLAWVEVKPKYLDYENCQILLIGEKMEAGVEPTTKDQKHDKETPQEEIEKLEHEDELRVEHLHGDDSVYDDLKISKDEYPEVATTW
ncbi:uroporphyrinogen-III synthase [Alternaria panax]|uniref:Uroporphyrinogen-III synthase n=1 Tax=Alternaria panax TaxID=48097 RepID=A0AAD4FI25_9PLEO|nr:uroporphyrinogen-III synthase [Alternaria panax]